MRRVIAIVVVAAALAACGGGSDETEPAGDAPDTPLTEFSSTVNKADDVANAVNQRTADLEAQLDN